MFTPLGITEHPTKYNDCPFPFLLDAKLITYGDLFTPVIFNYYYVVNGSYYKA